MVDVKKLITGFLILAAVASSGALIFTGVNTAPSPDSAGTKTDVANDVPKNAFVEQVADVAPNNPITVQTENLGPEPEQPITYATNLTEVFANKYARELIASNPRGPILDENGTPVGGLTPPDENTISKTLASAMQQVKSEFGSKPSTAVDIKQNYSDEDLKAYVQALGASAERTATKVDIATGKLPSPTDLAAAQDPLFLDQGQTNLLGAISETKSAFDGARTELSGLAVPSPMAELHTNTLVLVEHQKRTMELVENYQRDPLKAYAAIKIADKIIDQDTKNVQGEIQKLAAAGVFNNFSTEEKSTWLSFVNEIFGIQKAYAYFGLLEDSTTFARLATHITEMLKTVDTWLNHLLIAPLLRTIMNTIFNNVLSWIRNGGTPYFITNWKGFLGQAANEAIGLYIGKYAPNLCRNLGPLVQLSLNNTFLPQGFPASSACTLDRLVANVRGFYQNFNNGGWIAYGATTLPSGNYFGSLFATSQQLAAKAAENREASKNQGLASQGFHPFKVCPAGSTLVSNVASNDCTNAGGQVLPAVDGAPGFAIAQRLFIAEDANPKRLAAVRRFQELVGALFDAAITRLTKSIL